MLDSRSDTSASVPAVNSTGFGLEPDTIFPFPLDDFQLEAIDALSHWAMEALSRWAIDALSLQ